MFALAVWDEGWSSYNNCYLLVRGDQVVLIDTGKAEHFPHLQPALATLGKTEADVTALVATHGHPDHIGSAHRFTNARKYIHPNDAPMLTAEARELFTDSLPDHGEIHGLTCWLWGTTHPDRASCTTASRTLPLQETPSVSLARLSRKTSSCTRRQLCAKP